MKKKPKGLQSISQILADFDLTKKKYITREFQDYGYRLAMELDDEKHKSLYIKLAKEVDRKLLEKARIFVKDVREVKSKGKLFMWKLKDLRSKSLKEWLELVFSQKLITVFKNNVRAVTALTLEFF